MIGSGKEPEANKAESMPVSEQAEVMPATFKKPRLEIVSSIELLIVNCHFPYKIIYLNSATPLSFFSDRISHYSQQFKVSNLILRPILRDVISATGGPNISQ
jgi:hypothetical protein